MGWIIRGGMISEELKGRLLSREPFTDILGQEEAKRQVRAALLMGRNIIIAGPPGVGKTTLAKNVARLLPDIQVNDCGYRCTPENPACPSASQRGRAGRSPLRGGEIRPDPGQP